MASAPLRSRRPARFSTAATLSFLSRPRRSRSRMRLSPTLQQVMLGASALVIAGSTVVTGHDESKPVVDAAVRIVGANTTNLQNAVAPPTTTAPGNEVASETKGALDAFVSLVRPLSHPDAL